MIGLGNFWQSSLQAFRGGIARQRGQGQNSKVRGLGGAHIFHILLPLDWGRDVEAAWMQGARREGVAAGFDCELSVIFCIGGVSAIFATVSGWRRSAHTASKIACDRDVKERGDAQGAIAS